MIDDIERSVHFLCLFWKNNPIYLVCSLFYYVISSLLLGGTAKKFFDCICRLRCIAYHWIQFIGRKIFAVAK